MWLAGSAEGSCSLGSLLPEAFAVVREAAKRTLGMQHHEVQLVRPWLVSAVVLGKGFISSSRVC